MGSADWDGLRELAITNKNVSLIEGGAGRLLGLGCFLFWLSGWIEECLLDNWT